MFQFDKLNARKLWALIGTFIIMIFFQNCEQPSARPGGDPNFISERSIGIGSGNEAQNSQSGQGGQSGTLNGNGSGYAGKVQFTNLDLNGACPNQNSVYASESVIVTDNSNQKFLVRENCNDITPVPLQDNQLSHLAHSNDYILYNNLIYKNRPAGLLSELTTYYCRGTSQNDPDLVFDAKVYLNLQTQENLMDYELVNYGFLNNYFESEKLQKTTTQVSETATHIQFTTQRKITTFLSWMDSLFNLLFPWMNNNQDEDGTIVLTIDKSTLLGHLEVFDDDGDKQAEFQDLPCYLQ